MKKLIGAVLIAIPFVALFVIMGAQKGWVEATLAYLGAIGVCAMLIVGASLLAPNE